MHEVYRNGDSLTCSVADDSGEISRYDSVVLTGPREVALADEAGAGAFGVAETAPSQGPDPTKGETLTVVLKGIRNARVSDTVSADDILVSSGANAGQLRAIAGDGSETAPGGEWRCIKPADSDGLGLVLIR